MLRQISVQALALAATGLSAPALAAGPAADHKPISGVSMETIGVYVRGNGFSNPDACASALALAIVPTQTDRDYYVAAALTALAAGKTVTIWVDGCVAAPWYPSVPRVASITIDE